VYFEGRKFEVVVNNYTNIIEKKNKNRRRERKRYSTVGNYMRIKKRYITRCN
jgi:hypothetical protein